MNQRQFKGLFKKKGNRGSEIMKQITWQRCVIGTESSSFKSDTLEIIGARWRRRLVWKEKGYRDKLRYKEEKMFRK